MYNTLITLISEHSDQFLLTCMRYIELNPVHAGMVEQPGDYPWSSYASNAEGKNNTLITSHKVYSQLGVNETERQLAYRQPLKIMETER